MEHAVAIEVSTWMHPKNSAWQIARLVVVIMRYVLLQKHAFVPKVIQNLLKIPNMDVNQFVFQIAVLDIVLVQINVSAFVDLKRR